MKLVSYVSKVGNIRLCWHGVISYESVTRSNAFHSFPTTSSTKLVMFPRTTALETFSLRRLGVIGCESVTWSNVSLLSHKIINEIGYVSKVNRIINIFIMLARCDF